MTRSSSPTKTATRAPLLGLALVLAGALSGCDDVLLFDVGPDGRLLASCDRLGRTAAIGDASAPRHLAWVDPTSGEVERITSSTLPLAWPRACGKDVVAIVERRRLVTLPAGRELLAVREGRLDQPTPSPTGEQVAVLAAPRLGTPGALKVVDVASGAVVLEVKDALLGFAWTAAGELLVPVATAPRADAFDPGPGEVVGVSLDGRRETIARAPLAGATWLGASGGAGVVVLPLGEPDGPLGLAGFALDRPGVRRGEAAGVSDLWPSVDASTGRVLFTRARPDKPSLEGELRLTALDDLGRSTVVRTTGPVVAPRWVGPARLAYLTADDRLVAQDLDGSNRLELSARLKAACFGDAP